MENVKISNSVVNIFCGSGNSPHKDYNRVIEKIQENCENYDKIEVLTEQKNKTKECTAILSDYFLKRNQTVKAIRTKECGNYLQLKFYPALNYKSIGKMNLCKERLCLNCAYVSARKNSRYLIKATEGMQQRFVTLTVPNVEGEKLRITLNNMRTALKKMFRSLGIKNYYEKYEITYNDKTNTFHPHIHVLTELSNYTFSKSASNRMWAKYYNSEAGTSFDYLSTENKAVTDNVHSSLEMSKYITKPADINEQTIPVFDRELKGLHVVQSHGSYKHGIKSAKAYFEENKAELSSLLEQYEFVLLDYIFDGNNYINLN